MKIKVNTNAEQKENFEESEPQAVFEPAKREDQPEQNKSLVSAPAVPPIRLSEYQDIDTETAKPEPVNLEDAFSDIFKSSKSGTGEEELLRIASQFSLQITAPQIKCLLYLLHRADKSEILKRHEEAQLLKMFVIKWLEYKQNNNSDIFVMKALEHISLRHFINENSFKVNIDKG